VAPLSGVAKGAREMNDNAFCRRAWEINRDCLARQPALLEWLKSFSV
jgi:hypothetical protein